LVAAFLSPRRPSPGRSVAALRSFVSAQLMRGDKEPWLHDAQGLAGRAALALAWAWDVQAAVLAADTCRAVLLDEALRTGRPKRADCATAHTTNSRSVC
jgi:hypothetical protein